MTEFWKTGEKAVMIFQKQLSQNFHGGTKEEPLPPSH